MSKNSYQLKHANAHLQDLWHQWRRRNVSLQTYLQLDSEPSAQTWILRRISNEKVHLELTDIIDCKYLLKTKTINLWDS